jgi:general secretion pathway protein G
MTMISRSRKLMRASRRAAMRGMTLLEIMVVITIIGVVMGTVAVAVIPRLNDAKVETTKNSIRGGVETALKLYYTRHGKYPDTGSGLQVLVSERLLDKLPKDGWGNDFTYLNEGSNYKIVSYGADGAPGGDSYDADISSDTMDEKK